MKKVNRTEIGEEARDAGIVVHVADRIDVDQRRDAGDHDQHDGGQRVDPQRPVDVEACPTTIQVNELDARRAWRRPARSRSNEDDTQRQSAAAISRPRR